MINVGIIGHTGRLGKPLIEILNNHPYAKIVYKHSTSEPSKIDLSESEAELFVMDLPDHVSEEYLPKLEGKRIIDLSTDHRCSEGWTYGLPELNRAQIANAQYLTSPGCYPTSIILGLAPIKGNVRNVHVASNSGISGAGMHVQEKDNFRVYKIGRKHKHIPEIERMLGLKGFLFAPQRIDTADRGLVSTIFADYSGDDNLNEIYKEFYKSEPFVRIKDEDEIETKNVNGTNFCEIKVSKEGDRIIVISALDNLIKGGSGQAVQNFNLMYGLDETTGLL